MKEKYSKVEHLSPTIEFEIHSPKNFTQTWILDTEWYSNQKNKCKRIDANKKILTVDCEPWSQNYLFR